MKTANNIRINLQAAQVYYHESTQQRFNRLFCLALDVHGSNLVDSQDNEFTFTFLDGSTLRAEVKPRGLWIWVSEGSIHI